MNCEQKAAIENTPLLEERDGAAVEFQDVFVNVGQKLTHMVAVLGGQEVIDICEEWQTFPDPRIGLE